MAYLRNSTVNLLNVHYGLHALALNGAGVFFAVFLLKSGVPLAGVFAALAAIVAGRFLIRPLILVLAPRCGLRALAIAGTLGTAVQYLVLPHVHGVDAMLLALCVSASVGDTLYWTSYHAYFAALGDAEHRGHQIAAREAIAAVVGIVGPLAGGSALTLGGPMAAFGAAAAAQVLAAIPLFGTPDVPVAPAVAGIFKAAIPGILMFAADGWGAAGSVFAWEIALFRTVGENYASYGGAMAAAGVAGAVGGLVLGRHIDAGHGRRAVWLAYGGVLAMILLRAASGGSIASAIIANAVGALAGCLYIPTLMTAVYNQAKESRCTLRFHVATEGGWDIGAGLGCLTAALMVRAGLPLSAAILSSLAGAALGFVLLQRYYAALEDVTGGTAIEPVIGA